MEKRATQPNNMRKLFPYEPNNPTPQVHSKPRVTIAKNKVKHPTEKHKNTKKEKKQRPKLSLPPNKR